MPEQRGHAVETGRTSIDRSCTLIQARTNQAWPERIENKKAGRRGASTIVFAGKVVLDHVEGSTAGGEPTVALGGATSNGSALVGLAGFKTRAIGWAGADELTSEQLAELASRGVQVEFTRRGVSPQPRVLHDAFGEKSIQQDSGAGSWEPRDVQPEMLRDALVVHIDGWDLTRTRSPEAMQRLAAMAHELGVVVSVDAMGAGKIREDPSLAGTIRSLDPDIVWANEEEAELLDVEGSAFDHVPMLVVHRGPKPTIVRTDAARFTVLVEPIPRPKSLLGCGDATSAGALVGLANDCAPADAILAGHAWARAVAMSPTAQLEPTPTNKRILQDAVSNRSLDNGLS